MNYCRSSYLIHFGIQGQKWGVRRFQNEDGTLTEEGKLRYYDNFTDRQKKIFDQKMTDNQRRQVIKKLSQGKSWTQATKEMGEEYARKVRLVAGTIAATTATLANPVSRKFLGALFKSAGKSLVRAIKNTNFVQRGKLFMDKMMKRRSMVKNGAVVLKKGSYSVRDIPFGGYLAR